MNEHQETLFDEVIDRRGSHSEKWDDMEELYGISPIDGMAMWVADMDFRPPACVTAELNEMIRHGIYGYFGDDKDYKQAISWWMKARHGWDVSPKSIFSTNGLVNGAALCIDLWSAPGDGVLGSVDGFDQDEACGDCDDGCEILLGLLAS